jgi:tRNA modification GTPase
MRAFLNGQMDLSQAEAVADLIASDSSISHDLAMKQMRGGFSKKIAVLREELIKFASLIELELDFGEEDVEFANRKELKERITHIQSTIDQLVQSFKMGNVIKNGISTVIAGRPNAGKSTLLNALLNEDRAIVSEIAGTTRDTIEEKLIINGLQFRLIDTAGIREATDAIEAIGVSKTMEKIQSSAILVYVFDVIATPPETVKADITELSREGLTIIAVANKMDLNPYTKQEWYVNEALPLENIVTTSAINEMNIAYLKEKLVSVATYGNLIQDQSIVTNSRHYEALEGANQSLSAALNGMSQGVTSDFVAIDIRRSTYYLGLITGEISTDDLLDRIFRDFCIGK